MSTSVAAYPGALLTLAYTFYFVEESPSYLILSLGLVLPTAFSALSKFWGFLADYYSARKKFILVGWFSSTLVLLVPILHLEISTMLLATILGTALWSIGVPALVAEVMRRESPGFRFGIWWSLADVMYLLGSLSAGFLYKMLRLRIVLLLCLLWYLVNGFVIAVSYRTEVEVPRSRPSSLITELLEDIRTSFLRKECALLNTCS